MYVFISVKQAFHNKNSQEPFTGLLFITYYCTFSSHLLPFVYLASSMTVFIPFIFSPRISVSSCLTIERRTATNE